MVSIDPVFGTALGLLVFMAAAFVAIGLSARKVDHKAGVLAAEREQTRAQEAELKLQLKPQVTYDVDIDATLHALQEIAAHEDSAAETLPNRKQEPLRVSPDDVSRESAENLEARKLSGIGIGRPIVDLPSTSDNWTVTQTPLGTTTVLSIPGDEELNRQYRLRRARILPTRQFGSSMKATEPDLPDVPGDAAAVAESPLTKGRSRARNKSLSKA